MSDRPDSRVLLAAVARFLDKEIRPAVSDPRLAFRLLIAANLNGIVAAELEHGEAHERAQLHRLNALLGESHPADPGPIRAQALRDLERELSRRLREEPISTEELGRVREHVYQTLVEKLRVSNPRFDLSERIE